MRHQIAVTGLMAYATYLAWKCPCEKTLSCHLKEFFLSTGVAVGLVIYENELLLRMP